MMDWWTRSKNKGEKRGSMKRSFARRIQTQRMERWEEGEVWWWGTNKSQWGRCEETELKWTSFESRKEKTDQMRDEASPHSQFQGTWFWSVIEWSSSITETWNAICIITSALFGFLRGTDGAVARQSCPTRHDKPVKMRCICKQQILLDGSDLLDYIPTACTKNMLSSHGGFCTDVDHSAGPS